MAGTIAGEPVASEMERAIALQAAGDRAGAEAAFRALLGRLEALESLHRLGLLMLDGPEPAKGAALLEAANLLTEDPRIAHNSAIGLGRIGRRDNAIARLTGVVEKHPDYPPAYQTLAQFLTDAGRPAEAAEKLGVLLLKAIDGNAGGLIDAVIAQVARIGALPGNLILVANRLRVAGRGDQARRLLDLRLKDTPGDIEARLTHAMAHLPVIYASSAEIARTRAAYAEDLTGIAQYVARAPEAERAAAIGIVGQAKPFFLSYQGLNDRPLQDVYGSIITGLTHASGQERLPLPPRRDKIRVGFVTFYYTLHSVSKLFAGWHTHLDRSRFEVFGYHLGRGQDDTSKAIAAACDHWRSGDASARRWIDTIKVDAPDVLIYLELGMNGSAIQLAAHRLAPVQCMTWGHPVTSGLPEVDYFLSSDLMEPENGAEHYREELVRLPNLSIAYSALLSATGLMTRAEAGLRDDAIVYVCCQSLFKYLPEHDVAFVEIARAVPSAQFCFIGDRRQPTTQVFEARLVAAFRAAGHDPARHIVITAPVPFEKFASLVALGDVYLDSIGWSGGNTTLEAITAGVPVITLPTGLMRGRHTMAILTMMGLTDCIAADMDGFVRMAAELADPAKRAKLRAAVVANRHKLFDDPEPVRALEDFLEGAVEKARLGAAKGGLSNSRAVEA